MNSFTSLIIKRRSTRIFKEEPILSEQVESILMAALMAPTSKGASSWQFVVVEDRDVLKQLAACKKNGSAFLDGCTMAVVVLGDTTLSDAWVEDASIASIYMQLQAEDMGVGSCWCQVRNRLTEEGRDSEEYIRILLDIPRQFGVLSIIGFGYKAMERKPVDISNLFWEKVHIGKFGILDASLVKRVQR